METELLFAAAAVVGLFVGLGAEYFVAIKKTRHLFETVDAALIDGEITEKEAIEIFRSATSVKEAYEKLWDTITMKGVQKE